MVTVCLVTSESNDLIWKPAVELVDLMKAGELSARELATAQLERIEQVNPALNAIVTVTADRAFELADQADLAQARGDELGLLHGLPIAHKDLADTAGIRTTYGSPVYADHVPTENALVVDRAVHAGAVTVGKSNTPEFGAGSQTFNKVFGVTRNPYDLSKTCGGSSGGAAVALAAGMVPIADGSDLGGSLRNPAAFCNVVGLRPSPGRVPAWPKAHPWSHLSTEGPMARSVDDVALLLAAQAGPDRRNPIALETPGIAFAPPIEDPVGQLRVAWAPDLGGVPIDPAVTAALAGVPDIFAGLGHAVTEAAPDLAGARQAFDTLRAWTFGLSSGLLEHREMLKETLIWNIERGLALSIDQHLDAYRVRGEIYERVARFFGDFDVVLCPTTQVPPFDIDTEWVQEVNGVAMNSYIEWMQVCTDVTMMNCPAISMPAGFTPDGLPIGLQMVAAPRCDLDLLRIAKQFETVTQVGLQRPELG